MAIMKLCAGDVLLFGAVQVTVVGGPYEFDDANPSVPVEITVAPLSAPLSENDEGSLMTPVAVASEDLELTLLL